MIEDMNFDDGFKEHALKTLKRNTRKRTMKNYLKKFIKITWPAFIGFPIGQILFSLQNPDYTLMQFAISAIIFTILLFVVYSIIIGIITLHRRTK